MVWEEWRLTGLIQADGRVVRGRGEAGAGATRLHLGLSTRRDFTAGPKQTLELLLARGWREEGTTCADAKRMGRATVVLLAHGVRDGRPLGSGSDRRTFEVTHRAENRFLVRECSEGPRRDTPICSIQGQNGDLSFRPEWSRTSANGDLPLRPERSRASPIGTDELMAAAALSDGYLVSGPGLVP